MVSLRLGTPRYMARRSKSGVLLFEPGGAPAPGAPPGSRPGRIVDPAPSTSFGELARDLGPTPASIAAEMDRMFGAEERGDRFTPGAQDMRRSPTRRA